MEELSSTRHWGKKPHGSAVFARSTYDDFFGGQPRHTTPFPARFEDYCEIFGSAASVSSIPMLDLPPADDDFAASGDGDRRVRVDYSEIFGGLSGDCFTVSYEELFGGSNGSGVSSLDGRVRWGVLSGEQANEASEHLLEGYSKDHLSNLEIGEVASVPNHSDDVSSKQFSMSYHKTSWGITDDLISEKTSPAKFDALPEFTAVIDACDPVLEKKTQKVNEGTTNNTDNKRYIHDRGQENEAPSNSSCNAANSENLKVDQLPPSESNCDSLLDAPENEKHHSRSSSYHSVSSGDVYLSDVEYLNISEISLQTKPLQGPPPSRSPPQLIKKPEHLEKVHTDCSSNTEEGSLLKPKLKYHMNSSCGATKIHAIDESMEGNSFCNHNDMDLSSAAAASVAAVKVAMEQAQAQLKIAKELMDRKRDKYKRKVGEPKAMTCEDDGSDHEVELKSYSKVKYPNNLLKRINSINECTFLEREEIRNAGTTLNHEKKGRFSTSGENQPQVTPDEISGEWKTEKNYYELIRNGSLLSEDKDNYMHENEKKVKAAMYGCQDIYKDSKNGEQSFEVLENQKSSEASCSVEKLENDHNLYGANMDYIKESNKNVVHAIMEDFLHKGSASKLNDAYGCHLLDDTQNEGDVHEDNATKDNDNPSNSAVGSCLSKDSEEIFQASNSRFGLGVDNGFCEETKFNAAEEIFRDVGNKEEIHVSHVNFELNKSHEVFKDANEAVFQGRSDDEIMVSDGFCSNNTTEKIDATEETKKLNENECMKYLISSNASICMDKDNNNIAENEEVNGLQANEEGCIFKKKELEQEAIHNANGLENGKEIKDARIEHQEDESMGSDRNQELHNFEFLAAAEKDCTEKGSENTLDVPVACNLGGNKFISTSTKEFCQQCEESAPETILLRKEAKSLSKAPDITEVGLAEVAENHKHSIHIDEEENKNVHIEKESDKERAIKLEEKEREKEREKDRIGVERANHDAHQRALAESRERAERIAVERVTAEARQRALADAREKAGKAAEAEKASREARLRAERAAVERATEEARKRAIEKALAEKAAAEARSRMRKGNATAYFKADHIKEDSETRRKSSCEILQNTHSQSSCSTNGQRYSDSCDNVGGSESKLRCKARQERQQRTAERAAKALAEKNLRDCLAQREQAERDRFAESLDAEVRRWSNGKDGNLRALLSTLQYILGSDSGWQPIPLTDVLTAAAVKKAYRKATLCVHPDKLQQRRATIQQKYICEKVFDLLKEAWNKFNSEER
ncbi:auxilin-related protein 2 isoform X1 [Dendrobium catenatum]|uniref:auxilin-related protein 2 isoform X1 n=1 Tax=Dendrobium catenatum TaxID=906689 RepID=UPI00109F1A60|nr:auxilin-related protein 2 isoform X1 [Dendrobium catenatum]